MNWRKLVSSVCAASLLVTALSGCGSKTTAKKNLYDSNAQYNSVTDAFIAQNDNFTLSINETTMGVTLTNKTTGEVFGTNPADTGEVQLDELGMPIRRHPQVESVLIVEYLDVEANTTSKIISYTGAVNSGKTIHEKTENGLKVKYYFDDAKVMIPLEYTLRDDSVAVTLNPKEIQESDNMVISVSVAPFWCSVKNTEKINMAIQMEPWEQGKNYDRMGLDGETINILGIEVPSITIPVTPGRNLAVILEVAAMNNRQRRTGYNAAQEFTAQISNHLMQSV